ncbi:MAG: HU family DNA-binding protein [Paludibacteraceae bacterium]|nr:HU family DNA-binding protein [Paludibacteraceae bacterium]MBP6285050.1 HU family DNA-binding protein [Paludibacteraceae bacterium]
MNNKELISELSKRLHVPQKDIVGVLEAAVDAFSTTFQQGDDLSVQGFGTFQIRKKKERIIVNPTTKVRQIIPPKLTISFKISNTYKEKIKNTVLHGK